MDCLILPRYSKAQTELRGKILTRSCLKSTRMETTPSLI
nr:MAG TPA: hypothetical protein [Caudoviricetes sp.]